MPIDAEPLVSIKRTDEGTMDPQYQHALLSRPTADERGRESFLAAMRRFLITDLYAGNTVAWRERQAPAFARLAGD